MKPTLKKIFVYSSITPDPNTIERKFIRQLQPHFHRDNVLLHLLNPEVERIHDAETEVERADAICLIISDGLFNSLKDDDEPVSPLNAVFLHILDLIQNTCSRKTFFAVSITENMDSCDEFLGKWTVFNSTVMYNFDDFKKEYVLERCRNYSNFIQCLQSYNFVSTKKIIN